MKTEADSQPAMPNAFDRFDTAMKVILSVPKPAVVAEEKRQQEQRKAERATRKGRHAA